MADGKPVRVVGLVVALHKRRSDKIARDVIDAFTSRGVVVRTSPDVAEAVGGKVDPVSVEEMIRSDLIVVMGGDGTLLRYASEAAPIGTPLLGVYMGGFGFLTETNVTLLQQQIDRLIQGDYEVDERLMLSAVFGDEPAEEDDDEVRQRQGPTRMEALNDIVVHRGMVGSLLECQVAVDGIEVGHYRGDGLVLATPTGSTAYSLASGGPVVHPGVECIILTPMALHTLNIRPLVVGPDRTVTVKLVGGYFALQAGGAVTADGHNIGTLGGGETLTVRRADHCARLCSMGVDTFVDRLRQKLRWGAEI
jgi:NAD+ kinase